MRFNSTHVLARRVAVCATVAALAAAPVHALAPPEGKGGGKPGGSGGDGNTAPKFEVTVTNDGTGASNLWAPGPECKGATPDAKTSDIVTLVFFGHQSCATLTTSDGVALTDDLTIRTRSDASGNITAIEIEGQDAIGSEGVVHLSDPISVSATPIRGDFRIHAHAANVVMKRCNTHRMMNKTKCIEAVGTFSIDDVNYVLQASSTIESTIRYAPGEALD